MDAYIMPTAGRGRKAPTAEVDGPQSHRRPRTSSAIRPSGPHPTRRPRHAL